MSQLHSGYLNNHYLPAPLPSTRVVHPMQPITNLAIDQWIFVNANDSLSGNVMSPGFLSIDDVPSDQVVCFIIVIDLELQDDIYLNIYHVYNLYLAVDVPESSGIPHHFLQSPLLALASFRGSNTDPDAPKWTGIQSKHPILFRQPRGAMSEVFSALAWWEDNHLIKALAIEAIQWAVATAVGTPAESKRLLLPYMLTMPPFSSQPVLGAGAPARAAARTRSKRGCDVVSSPCARALKRTS